MEKSHPFLDRDCDVSKPIIVVVPGRAASSPHRGTQPGLPGHILKLSVSYIVVQRHASLCPIVRQKEVDFTVVVVVEKAGPGFCGIRGITNRFGGQPRLRRHIHKPQLDLRRRFQHRRGRLDCARVLSLLSVGQAHGRADFVLRDVLEFLQVLASVVDVGGLLIGARESELG